MTREQQAQQARAFLGYRAKCGATPWEYAWSWWSASKSFGGEDYRTIRGIVQAELIARGEIVLTDAPDFEPEEVER